MCPQLPSVPSVRIIRLKELVAITGLARSTVYDRLDKKSPRYDEAFPRPFKLGVKSVGWLEHEVHFWIRCKAFSSGERTAAI